MKFYDCATAPSPRRVRWVIAEKNITVEPVQVDLGRNEHLGDAFKKINPLCSVPVLELDDGTFLNESTAISVYLDETFPGINLTGTSPKERALVLMWQREMDWNGLNAVAECFRNRSKGFVDRALTGSVNYPQIPELSERARLRVRHFFGELDARLSQSEFVALDRFTIADITAFITIEFARAIKESVPESAVHLAKWRERIAARPGSRV